MKLMERRRALISALSRFIRTVFGKPPLTLEACVDDKSTVDYKVYGESIQDGTPTPDAPIEVESVGVKSGNLFDESLLLESPYITKTDNGYVVSYYPAHFYGSMTLLQHLKSVLKPDTTYTLTRLVSGYTGDSGGAINIRNSSDTLVGIPYGNGIRSVTFSLTQEEIDSISNIYVYGYTAPKEPITFEFIQLEEGDSFTDYEPYGKYKIPIKANGKNLYPVASYKCPAQHNAYYTSVWISSASIINLMQSLCGKKIVFSFSVDNEEFSGNEVIIHFNDGSYWSNNVKNIQTLPTGKNISTIEFRARSNSETANGLAPTIYNIQLEILDTHTSCTAYEPYQEPITTNIYLDEPLRKIGDYADYIDFENQVVVRNTGHYIFDGTEEISIPGSTIEGHTPFRYTMLYSARQPFVCNYLPFLARDYLHAVSECLAKYSTGGQMFFVISNDRIPLNDITSFKSWLTQLKNDGNPLKVYYGLNLSTETPITLPHLPTFKGTTIYSVDTNIQPSNMEVTYYSKERSVS